MRPSLALIIAPLLAPVGHLASAQEAPDSLEELPLRCHPRLAPYLASLNLLPADANVAGALIADDPISSANASVKETLLEYGFSYMLFQSFGMSVTPSRVRDPAVGGLWAGQGFGFLEVFDHSREGGSAGWISTEINWVTGLGGSVEYEDPSARIGTVSQPQGLLVGDGFWIAELAWQQSFFDGTLVATVGMVDQQNYFDVNTFANKPVHAADGEPVREQPGHRCASAGARHQPGVAACRLVLCGVRIVHDRIHSRIGAIRQPQHRELGKSA